MKSSMDSFPLRHEALFTHLDSAVSNELYIRVFCDAMNLISREYKT